jgi:hypothetical protein
LDQKLSKLILLWRERTYDWAAPLAGASAEALQRQYELVDEQFWNYLARQTFTIEPDTTSQNRVEAHDLVELTLHSAVPGIAKRMGYHPLRVIWTVTLPGGNERTIETNGMKLVQYFSEKGTVTVTAALRWHHPDIKVPVPRTFEVVENRGFGSWWRRFSLGAIEFSVLAIATGFAVATAMSTQYGATFGSFKEYIALFIWGAGAGGGGNIFKQLGSTSTPGGQADATLPSRT